MQVEKLAEMEKKSRMDGIWRKARKASSKKEITSHIEHVGVNVEDKGIAHL